jgi:soluble lytic murein transglycosylase
MIDPARLFLLALLASAALVGGPAQSGGDARTPATPEQQAPVDSAAAELGVKRPWHAARLLRGASGNAGAGLDPRGRLIAARAEVAAKNWERVRQLLEGQPELDRTEGGEGWLLLGRALEETERWAPAADAYGAYLRSEHGRASADAPAITARRIRALEHASAPSESLELLGDLRADDATLASWIALDAARVAADRDDLEQLRSVLAMVTEPDLKARVWDLEPRTLLAKGDSAAAETALTALIPTLQSDARRGEASALLGDLLRLRGGQTEAVAMYRTALSNAPSAAAGRAARYLLDWGALDATTSLAVARALERSGDLDRALEAYDLHAAVASPAQRTPAVRLAHATIMAQIPGRMDDAATEFAALQMDANVGATALERWAELRGQQGRTADMETLEARLMERFPASPQAASALFLRGDAAQDDGKLDEALRDYQRLVAVAPSQDRAGLARMRWGQIHLARNQPRQAAEVFEGYLASFPTGRRWEEATYWAAKARMELGETTRARQLIGELRTREPFGYYAILAGDLVDEPFEVDVPPGEEPPFPQWIRVGLRTLDLLSAAGLREGAVATVAQLRSRAGDAAAAEGLRLANELTRRGYTLEGINVASEVRARGEPLTRRLLEAMYPFPDSERIRREAREQGADPLLVAALIRQESAWEEGIRSAVGAVGLMQIMPETGRQLFDQLDLGTFQTQMLEVGDLNLHLGTSYLVELLDRYGGKDDPLAFSLALSGYNAGPHRADVWKNFREAEDPLRFNERIPFAETREYVKRIYRNRAIYRALYGPPSTQQQER